MRKYQEQLAWIWSVSFCITAVCLFLFTNLGYYNNHVTDVWKWYLTNVVPTLTLIFGTFASFTRRRKIVNHHRGDGASFILAKWFSLFYLFVLFALVVAPVLLLKPTMEEAMQYSKSPLRCFQALTAIIVGAFFWKTPSDKDAKGNDQSGHSNEPKDS